MEEMLLRIFLKVYVHPADSHTWPTWLFRKPICNSHRKILKVYVEIEMLLKKTSFRFYPCKTHDTIKQKTSQQTKQRRTIAFSFQSPLRNADPLKNNWLTTGTSLESHRRGYRVPPQYPPNWCSGALVESFVVCSLAPPRFNYMHNLMSFRR